VTKPSPRAYNEYMRARGRIALAVATIALVACAFAAAATRTPARGDSPRAARLVAFRSCGELLVYARSHTAPLVGPWGFGGGGVAPLPVGVPSAAASDGGKTEGVDYSGTNVQEQGVDEPDLAKTDGTTLFAVANGRVESVDVSSSKPRLLDTLKLDSGFGQELLLSNDRLLVLTRTTTFPEPLPGVVATVMPIRPTKTVLTEVDVSKPSALRVVRTLTIDGAYVTARMVGGLVRVVVSTQLPDELPLGQPAGSTPAEQAASRERNRQVVLQSKLGSWLPTYRVARRGHAPAAPRPLVQCRRVTHPKAFSGVGMLTILTIDLAKGIAPVDSTGVMTDGRIVYASTGNLYVATEPWAVRPLPASPTTARSDAATTIHRFDISSAERTQYRGSGTVSGYLLNQWSLSEDRGILRVVSTEQPAWWSEAGGESETFLTTLRPGDGALTQVGRVGGLGKGERVYAVRFVGETGYVVTFRQIDPLYTVDLSDPAAPRVLGELTLPGYSAYLHPVAADLLLGIGQDVDEHGRPLGTQLSLFDVSNLRKPARLAHATLGPGWSEAESDHHAFLFWPKTGLVVVPFAERAVGYRVDRAHGIDLVGRIEQGTDAAQRAPIRRAFVVGGSVFTVSDSGVESSSLTSLAQQGWAGFPQPAPPPVSGTPPISP